jgi:GNAT superfamily N-acetyltransferase
MRLRTAEPGDAMAVARVHVRSWQVAYQSLLPSEYLDGLRPEDRAKVYDFANRDPEKPKTIVADENGLIVGFATTAPARDAAWQNYGELCALYVDPERWGQGIGQALIAAARAQLCEQEFGKALLWVLVGNSRAERFYLADQWTTDGFRRSDVMWGVKVEEVKYERVL